MSRQRLQHLDVLRAIAFILVVMQHILGGYSLLPGIRRYEYIILKFFYALAKPAVPIFLMLSAIALFYTYSDSFNIKEYYLKRVKFVLIPYVLWSIINMVKLAPERMSSFFLQLLAGNGLYHLWYMGMIIRLYLYFPLILWAAKKIHKQNAFIRVMVAVFSVVVYYLVTNNQTPITISVSQLIFGSPSELEQRIVYISPLFWFLFFNLGIYIAMNYQKAMALFNRYQFMITGIFIGLFIYAYLYEMNILPFDRGLYLIYTVFSLLFMYVLSTWLASIKRVYAVGKFLSDYSYAAYMAHVLVLQHSSNEIILRIGNGSYLLVGVLTLIFTVVYTPILIWAMGLIPFHEFLTGTKKGLTFGALKQFLVGLRDGLLMKWKTRNQGSH